MYHFTCTEQLVIDKSSLQNCGSSVWKLLYVIELGLRIYEVASRFGVSYVVFVKLCRILKMLLKEAVLDVVE